MSGLAEIQRRIQSTSALIAQHESVIATCPPDEPNPLSINIVGLQKLKRRLEAQFAEIAKEQELEVYRYRLIEDESERPTLAGVAEAWGKFQVVFGEVYSALLKTGSKQGGSPPPVFGYAYSFAGSVGVVATLPRDYKNLVGESTLEDASRVIFDLIERKGTERLIQELGRKPVEAFNDWVSTHLQNRFGIGLEWQSASGGHRFAEVAYPQLQLVHQEISKTTTESTITVTGELVAVDTTSGHFRLIADDKDEYEGDYSTDAINSEHEASLPARYVATITKTTKLFLAAKEKPTITLRKLDRIKPQKAKAKQ